MNTTSNRKVSLAACLGATVAVSAAALPVMALVGAGTASADRCIKDVAGIPAGQTYCAYSGFEPPAGASNCIMDIDLKKIQNPPSMGNPIPSMGDPTIIWCPQQSAAGAPPPPPPPPEPPKDAVQVDIQQSPFNVTVNVTNTSSLPGKCTYDAKPTNNPLAPPVHRNFDLGANGNASLSFLAPPIGTTYHVVVSCKGTFNGKSVEFGHVEQDVTGSV